MSQNEKHKNDFESIISSHLKELELPKTSLLLADNVLSIYAVKSKTVAENIKLPLYLMLVLLLLLVLPLSISNLDEMTSLRNTFSHIEDFDISLYILSSLVLPIALVLYVHLELRYFFNQNTKFTIS